MPASVRADREPIERRVVVMNPTSGSGDHADQIRSLAAAYGFEVRETEAAGDAVKLAEEAGREADLVAAAGGDGTVNEVVRGLLAAEATDDVDLAIVPAGTGNDFAEHIGVRSIPESFEVAETGPTRAVDLGMAADRPFVNSCVGGLTADASAATSSEMKERWGVLAYVFSTLRSIREFDGARLHVETGGEETWDGEALLVLLGNGRRFPPRGRRQANMEDGQFEVMIVERRPTSELLEERIAERLFGGEAKNILRFQAPSVTVTAADSDPVTYSLDGEIVTAESLHAETLPGQLRLRVGSDYEVDPA